MGLSHKSLGPPADDGLLIPLEHVVYCQSCVHKDAIPALPGLHCVKYIVPIYYA